MPQMSVDEIKKVLAEGGSVFVRDSKGVLRHVTDPNRLPTEAELAKGDEHAANASLRFTERVAGLEQKQLEDFRAEIDSLLAQAKGRNDDAAKGLQSQIAELKAKLEATRPAEGAKPAPGPVVPVAPAPVKPVQANK